MSDANLTLERAAARFIVNFGPEHINETALKDAKRLIKDQFAIQIGASQLPWSKQVRHARELRPGPASIVAEKTKVAAADAAYLNATYGHGFEYDDLAGNAHPGCCVVPTAFAVGEEVDATLEQVLVAMVSGYEAYVRIGYLGSPDLLNVGWQPHSVLANFGAAATTAKLYGLNEEQTLHALAIALSHASGTTEYASTGGSIKRVHAGIGVRNGIESADLARAGVTGPLRFLTGNRGLYKVFIGKEIGDKERDIFSFDDPLRITQLSFKAYCSCACNHAYIDAMSEIRSRVNEIESIDANIQTMVDAIVGSRNANIYEPHNIEELQYSLPVQMALSALDMGNGYKTHRSFLEGNLELTPETDVMQFARRIKIRLDHDLDKRFPRNFVGDVTVHYADGKSEHIFRPAAKGMPGNPFTPDEHQAKLDELSEEVVGKEQAAKLFELVDRFDPGMPVNEVTSLLQKG